MRFERIVCAVVGHRYVTEKVLSYSSRKIGCTRCNRKWAMNDNVRCILPWDHELEGFYKDFDRLKQARVNG